MKDYNSQINLKRTNDIINFAIENNFAVYTKEGGLNDFCIIDSEKYIKINNVRPRKFIILYYKFLNGWENTLHLKYTDNLNTAIEYAKNYECEEFLKNYA